MKNFQKLHRKTISWKTVKLSENGSRFSLKSSGNALLADDMGLGKNCTNVSVYRIRKTSSPVLVVAPLVTLTNWQREIERFMKKKSRNGRIVENSVPTITSIRSRQQKEISDYDFYLINYELVYKRQIDLSN